MKAESSSTVPLYRGIGRSRGGVNPPVMVRHLKEGVNPPEASHLQCGVVHKLLIEKRVRKFLKDLKKEKKNISN